LPLVNVALLPLLLRGQTYSKADFEMAEELIKSGEVVEASIYYCKASAQDPKNSKYQKKCRETSKAASILDEAQGRQEMSRDPAKAETLLRDSSNFDPSNRTASEALAALTEKIQAAKTVVYDALDLIQKGQLDDAGARLASVNLYKTSLAFYHHAEEALDVSRKAVAAQTLFRQGNAAKAIELLTEAERSYPSDFIHSISKQVRHDVEEDKLRAAMALPAETPLKRIERIRALEQAVKIDPTNPHGTSLLDGDISDFTAFLLAITDEPHPRPTSAARISLERLRIIQDWAHNNSQFQQGQKSARAQAYPASRVRVVVDDTDECSTVVTKDSVRSALQESLSPFAIVDDQKPDFILRLFGVACSAVDVPRDGVQKVNSTYVAATTQVPNPDYTNLQSQLMSAEQELNRAAAANAQNGNLWTGIALGSARRRVNDVQRAMSRTAPYLPQDVVQQYQYDRFEAYRAYKIRATLQVAAASSEFVAETKIAADTEHRSPGISGVLPQDRSGIQNTDPVLPTLGECAQKAAAVLSKKLDIDVRELLAEYLDASALDQTRTAADRLAAVLYLRDISGGTKFEYNPPSDGLATALLAGGNAASSFLDSLKLPPVPHSFSPNRTAPQPRRIDLDAAITSVVGVETDADKSGSGFFVSANCLVVTNAHVIEGAETMIVRDSSKKIFVAQVAAKDLDRDLALLTTNARACSALPLGDSDSVAIGQEVYAIGNPLGLTGTVTKGIVSAIRSVSGRGYIQIDATINPGNSGGPLLGTDGAVIGVTTFKVRGFEGLNFAVGANEIRGAFGQFLH
jgi:S1-C subfamily serine protease/tetratricopeptide (TPR) repeat protein